MSERRDAVGTGVLTDGKVDWDDAKAFTAELKTLGNGSIVVRAERATRGAIRSLRANRYYWGHVLKLMANESGQDKDDIHDLMCARFLKHRVTLINRETGEIEQQDVPRRSSKLSPDEFWDFVEQVRLFAAEFLGITTQQPDPNWRQRDREAA